LLLVQHHKAIIIKNSTDANALVFGTAHELSA